MIDIIDYRGDCWKAYQDVGLCLRIIPSGKTFEFIIENQKLENINKIISHNGGAILEKTYINNDVRLKVKKLWSQPQEQRSP